VWAVTAAAGRLRASRRRASCMRASRRLAGCLRGSHSGLAG
jgi:hypothetical protein